MSAPNATTIWVDADACPAVIKDILFRAADRTATRTVLVANQLLRVPPSPHIRAQQVPAGFDVADNHIAQQAQPGDIVVTADIPLAAQVVAKGALALNPRGELYSDATIREALTLRNFMTELRDSGVQTGGPAAFSQRDRQAFAAQLDKLLQRLAARRG
ncbi:YaiI/YqxD family protein [Vogesella indigofera]|uniref:YaiI/YqxD family protein n=1 Tax=Vogesella indigofera TaxID=45465 RepID=UPI00234F27DA|nr:YaiI/YqxD family protein [Vogesella indigofera]MDC7702469.1 YaiI/YqxD family protein [Vogesella indigofera]